jgi:DNA-binding transcriptional MerR regulator
MKIAPGLASKGVPIWAWRAAVPGKGQRAERRLLRISELAALTEVPPASIKFYIKEGLLPPPVKTSRNMAYYDETFVEKIRLIKELQAQHFLPLRVIRDIINQNNGNGSIEETKALLDLKGYLLGRPIGDRKDPLPEKEVIRQYNTYEEELESLRRMRIVTPWQEGDERMYGGDDLDFLEALENNRRLGFTREIGFQVEDLEIYLKNLEVLAKEEVKLLVSRTASKLSTEEIRRLAERGIRGLGPLLVVLRRKMILKVLAELGVDEEMGDDPEEGNGTAGMGRAAERSGNDPS